MSRSTDARERTALQAVADEFRRKGYEVIVEPRGEAIPEFLRGFYEPDLVARSAFDSIVLEVKSSTQHSLGERFSDIAARVNSQPGWRFSLFVMAPGGEGVAFQEPLLPISSLEKRHEQARGLTRAGPIDAAFMVLWSVAEGYLRHLAKRVGLPLEHLPPTALIRELYSAGELSRDHYGSALELLQVRNNLVHGFAAMPGEVHLEALERIIEGVKREVAP